MTLDQCYAKYQGQSVLVPGAQEIYRGQCAQWADLVLNEVYGMPYRWGDDADAINWWLDPGTLLAQFIQVPPGVAKKGDFVVWGTGVGSVDGHIDVCMQDGSPSGFKGADTNWAGNKTVHMVQHDYKYVLGYLRPKEGEEMVDDAGARLILSSSMFLAQDGDKPDRQPTIDEVKNLIGRTYNDALSQVMTYQPWKDNYAKVKYYNQDVANASGGEYDLIEGQVFKKKGESL